MELAAELGVALSDLRTVLASRNVATDLEVITVDKVDKNGVRKKISSVGKGWTISSVKTHEKGERTICLLEDGTIRMTQAVEDDGKAVDLGTVDLSAYPIHPDFLKAAGYATTQGSRSEIFSGEHPDIPFENGLYGIDQKTINLAINVENLERQARANGRLLLGMPPN